MSATTPGPKRLAALRWRTPLCERVGVEHPIVLAPMAGGPSSPELAAAVAEAGGIAMLAASGVPADDLRDQIRAVRARTGRPFGVNFLLAGIEDGNHDSAGMQRFLDRFRAELGLPPGDPEPSLPAPQLAAQLEVCVEERVPILGAALGEPAPLAAARDEIGAQLWAMVTSVEEARRVEAGGVDVIVAQGGEAGGHRSALHLGPEDEAALVGTMALVPQVADAVSVPVVAAGGIADGRGVVAALALGAQAAQVGTRFLVARESGAFPAWKEALLAAAETDTVVTRAYTGRPARGVRNRLHDVLAAEGPRPLAWPLQRLAAADIYEAARERGDADLHPLLGGQATRLLRPDQSAAEILAEIVAEARDLLGSGTAAGSRLGGSLRR
jgi:nitronate monooxygenase